MTDIATTIETRFGTNYPVIDAIRILATEQTNHDRATRLATLQHDLDTLIADVKAQRAARNAGL